MRRSQFTLTIYGRTVVALQIAVDRSVFGKDLPGGPGPLVKARGAVRFLPWAEEKGFFLRRLAAEVWAPPARAKRPLTRPEGSGSASPPWRGR